MLTNELYGKFTQVPNLILVDTNIKHSAFRQYCYLISKPSGWTIRNTDICNQLKIAKSTVTDNFKNLISNKYMDRTSLRNSNGKFIGGYNYRIFSIPTETDKNTESVKTGTGKNIADNNTYSLSDLDLMKIMAEIEEKKKKKNRAYTQSPRSKTKKTAHDTT